jgi:hypothetical protein
MSLRQCVGLRKTGDEKFFQRDRSFIWFYHCASFDHLFGPHEYRRWNRQPKNLGGLKVDQQLELGWLLHRQIGGLGAFQILST